MDDQQKQAVGSRRPSLDEDESKVVEAAWRWRFGRRWVQEQAKQFDPEFGHEDDQEEWDDALGYLDACGPGFNLIARTSSEFGNDARLPRTTSLVSQDSVGKSLNSLLMDDSSYSQQEVSRLNTCFADNVQCKLSFVWCSGLPMLFQKHPELMACVHVNISVHVFNMYK